MLLVLHHLPASLFQKTIREEEDFFRGRRVSKKQMKLKLLYSHLGKQRLTPHRGLKINKNFKACSAIMISGFANIQII